MDLSEILMDLSEIRMDFSESENPSKSIYIDFRHLNRSKVFKKDRFKTI